MKKNIKTILVLLLFAAGTAKAQVEKTFMIRPYKPVEEIVTISISETITEMMTLVMGPNMKPAITTIASFGS